MTLPPQGPRGDYYREHEQPTMIDLLETIAERLTTIAATLILMLGVVAATFVLIGWGE